MGKVQNLYNISVLKFYHKLVNEKLPDYFKQNIQTSQQHKYQTRNCKKPPHEFARTRHAKHSIRNHLPKYLKTLPNSITGKVHTHSLHGFSMYCKKFFLNEYE